MVKNNTLLLIACIVWSAAGFNVLRLGIIEYPPYLSIINFLLSAAVFTVFQIFIFGRLVKKHTKRIDGYGDEKQLFIKVVYNNGGYDNGRYTAAFASYRAARVYRRVLYGSGSVAAACGNIIR